MRKLYLYAVLFLVAFFQMAPEVNATHIRAGEITTERISSLTYRITITGYRDRSGVEWGSGVLSFGHDGEEIQLAVTDWAKSNLDDETETNKYVTTPTFHSTSDTNSSSTQLYRTLGYLNT